MKRIMLILLALIFVSISSGIAQIPGDFNCNGQVNALDWTYLVNITYSGLIDSTTCTWRNGDLNLDSLNHTVADWWQWLLWANGDTLDHNPPLPYDLDSIIIGEAWAAPGQGVLLPINMRLAEPMHDFSMHIRYDTTYFENPAMAEWTGYTIQAYWAQSDFWLLAISQLAITILLTIAF